MNTSNKIPLLSLALAIGAFAFVLTEQASAFLRDIAYDARIDFIPIIPILSAAMYFVFKIRGRLGETLAMTAAMILFALPLAGLWASGHTQTIILSGALPINDGRIYYADALNLMDGFPMSDFSARRPFFSGLLAFFLSITDSNLTFSLAIFTALTAFSAYLTAREIQQTHGAETAVFALMIFFLFFRFHSGSAMTENLGTPLGLLGFALLWRGAADKKLSSVAFGLFISTLALNARAGAFFVLPFFILWAGYALREAKWISWKAIMISGVAVALGFAANIVFTKLTSVSSGVPFANFAYSLYGLASGGQPWFHIYDQHPEVMGLAEPEQSAQIYELAFEVIRNNPLGLLRGAWFNWQVLFSDTLYSLYSYVAHENWNLNPYVNYGLFALSALGLFASWRGFKQPVHSLILAGAVGFLLSVPFAPPIDTFRMRQYAASIGLLGVVPALGVGYLLSKFKLFAKTGEDQTQPTLMNIFAVAFTVILLVGAPVVKSNADRTLVSSPVCEDAQESIVIRLDENAFIRLTDESNNWVPDFEIDGFRKGAHSISDGNMIEWLKNVPADTALIMTVNRVPRSGAILIVMPLEWMPEVGAYASLCGRFEEDEGLQYYRDIFYVEKVVK